MALVFIERPTSIIKTAKEQRFPYRRLSPISIWEPFILAEKGRISLQPDAVTWVNLALTTWETREAKINHAIAILSRKITLPHQDPADRFIAATAIYYESNLATVDAHLTGYSGIQTLS